jgi:hypothetical protein
MNDHACSRPPRFLPIYPNKNIGTNQTVWGRVENAAKNTAINPGAYPSESAYAGMVCVPFRKYRATRLRISSITAANVAAESKRRRSSNRTNQCPRRPCPLVYSTEIFLKRVAVGKMSCIAWETRATVDIRDLSPNSSLPVPLADSAPRSS